MTRDLGSLRSPEIPAGTLLAVPLGATEQHGPHLPLGTDTAVATALCRGLAERRSDVLVGPAVPYGSSGEHAGFPGTLSIGRRALEILLVELVRSADEFAGVILVNGHGGNLAPLRSAVGLLRSEGRRVLAWMPSGPPDDSHAGHTETSVILQLRPEEVALAEAQPGNTTPLPELLDDLRAGGVAAVSPNGVLGDPTGAHPEHGAQTLATWTKSLCEAVSQWLDEDE